jgi:hypothetical protein
MRSRHVVAWSPVLFTLFWVTPPASADSITFRTRASFEAAVRTTLVDDYSDPRYRVGDIRNSSDLDEHSDAHMSAVLGETSYRTTGWPNHNLVGVQAEDAKYCGGCNGSFLLTFAGTSLGSSSGVGGVGFDFTNADMNLLYGALVTFGDGTVRGYALPFSSTGWARDTPRFWGITAPELIYSIHFGPRRGLDASTSGAFVIDNLTLAAEALDPVPEPATLMLVATGLGAALARRRWRLAV